jgi:preprotein translocase subunit SecD
MRKYTPYMILAIGLLALAIDFLPNLKLPDSRATDGTRPIETKLGLDLRGGLRVEYQVQPVGGVIASAADVATIRDIIERRVNSTGVSEPLVQTQGSDRIIVELPGVSNPDEIRSLLGTTGRLDFIPLPKETYGSVDTATGQATQGTKPVPTKGAVLDDPALKPLFSGDQIATSNVATNSTGERVVAFTLKSEGANLFSTYTSDNIGSYFAIALDGTIVSAPYIQSAITGGEGQISGGGTGGFAVADATSLVTILKFGSLPFPIAEIGVTEVKATLGAAFLNQALFAGAVGILLVFLFMLLHYRLAGAVASAALIFYMLIVLALFRLIPVTLTLAGIAGFVLSIGMAVDANILIFERTKEELRIGKGVVPAVEAGFSRAWNSILDSNVSSLITAFILFYFGSSTIKGFALVLIIGVLCSMFTAISLTRAMLRAVIHQQRFSSPYLYGVGRGDLDSDVAKLVATGLQHE